MNVISTEGRLMGKKMDYYGSDYVVDVIKKLDLDYIAFNPGSTFRGLHDSIVNHGNNENPEIVLCSHEKIAVQVAHGYAKVAGKPILVACHDTVGLLHATNAIYYAYIDRVPIVILGATGPMDVTRRRPRIDWIHTVLINGNIVRNYVKWDDQPHNLESVSGSLLRAYRTAVSEPKGPVYVCLDVSLQEDMVTKNVEVPSAERYLKRSRIQGEPHLLQETVELLLNAESPVIIPEILGKNPEAVGHLVNLAELTASPVYDLEGRYNFPNTHPLDLTGSDIIRDTDMILMLDVRQPHRVLKQIDGESKRVRYVIREDAKIVQIGLDELMLNGFMQDLGSVEPADISITADTSIALSCMINKCEKMLTTGNKEKMRNRFEATKEKHDTLRKSWLEESKQGWNKTPISASRLSSEIWSIIEGEDWVVTGKNLNGWIRRLWRIDDPHRFYGWSLGTATNIGISLGVALAYKGSNTTVLDIQADGDLMYDCGALWVGAHQQIPFLAIMYNNRAYGNSYRHQTVVAKQRERRIENASIGTEIDNPAPDFARLATSMGCRGIGPVMDPDEVRPALEEAMEQLRLNKIPVLVDIICE